MDLDYRLETVSKATEGVDLFQNNVLCNACSAAVAPINKLLKSKALLALGEFVATGICEHYKMYGGIPSVCRGAIDLMAVDLLPAVADGIFSKQRVCDEVLHACPTPHITELSAESYLKRVLDSKPDFLKDNDYIDNIYEKINSDPNKAQRKMRRSIQVSDLHVDHGYKIGAPSGCNFPICCRDNGIYQKTTPGSVPAGKWGTYGCDVPEWTIQNMFKFIGEN